MSRFVFIVLDGVGVGALPDAADYGDAGSDTLGNLSRVVDLRLPFLAEARASATSSPSWECLRASDPWPSPAAWRRSRPARTRTVGHWEHMGLVTSRPFPTYPDGFPEEVLGPFRERIGRGVLGNKPASGTVIIDELGAEHLATGRADRLHVGRQRLSDSRPRRTWCLSSSSTSGAQIAREILQGPHAVARVIARPFTGAPGAFVRTKDRRDFSLAPPGPTYLDLLHDAGVPVLALGKVGEVFAGRGVTRDDQGGVQRRQPGAGAGPAASAARTEAASTRACSSRNLVDFDMVWGHRNDVDGFAAGLAAVDAALPGIVAALDPGTRSSSPPTTEWTPPRRAPTTAGSTSPCCSTRGRPACPARRLRGHAGRYRARPSSRRSPAGSRHLGGDVARPPGRAEAGGPTRRPRRVRAATGSALSARALSAAERSRLVAAAPALWSPVGSAVRRRRSGRLPAARDSARRPRPPSCSGSGLAAALRAASEVTP